MAAHKGHESVVRLLVEHKAEVNAAKQVMSTPLACRELRCQLLVVLQLLRPLREAAVWLLAVLQLLHVGDRRVRSRARCGRGAVAVLLLQLLQLLQETG